MRLGFTGRWIGCRFRRLKRCLPADAPTLWHVSRHALKMREHLNFVRILSDPLGSRVDVERFPSGLDDPRLNCEPQILTDCGHANKDWLKRIVQGQRVTRFRLIHDALKPG